MSDDEDQRTQRSEAGEEAPRALRIAEESRAALSPSLVALPAALSSLSTNTKTATRQKEGPRASSRWRREDSWLARVSS